MAPQRTHVVFGANFSNIITQMGGSTPGTIIGASGNEVIYGGAADQTIILGSGTNFVNTGVGHDTIDGFTNNGTATVVYSPFDVSVHLSNGANTLWFEQDGTNANFITTSTIYHGIPTIDLRSLQELSGNSITLDAATVQSMTPENVLTINGDGHDTVYLVATDIWTTSSGFAGYTTYSALDNSRIEIQDGIHVVYVPPATPVMLSFTLGTLMDGTHGFELTSTATNSASNYASAVIAPTGDGFDELLISNGRSFLSPYSAAFTIQGQGTFHASVPFTDASVTLINFDTASEAFSLSPQVLSIGDFTGDGLNDFLFAGIYGLPSLIVLGQPGPLTSPVSLGPTNSISLSYPAGYSNEAAALGDVTGDGFSDIIFFNSTSGAGAVVFGSNTDTAGMSINLSTLNGSDGFQILTPGSFNQFIPSVAGANFTGDGMNDIFVSAYNVGVGVILGNTPVFSPYVNITSAGITGADGFIITNNPSPLTYFNIIAPTNIGDFTGSGIDDIAVESNNNVYVIFGNASFLTATSFNIATMTPSQGIELTSGTTAKITSIAYLGDFNGSGLPAFAFIDADANGGKGAIYVIFGNTTFTSELINYTTLTSNEGFVITDPSINLANATLGGGGDLNGSGLDDLVVTVNGNAYVVFGGNFSGAITQMGDSTPGSIIYGLGSNDVIYAGAVITRLMAAQALL